MSDVRQVKIQENEMVEKMVEMTWAFPIPPGEHIQVWLNDCGMSVIEFCKRVGISRATYYRILKGEQQITADIAYRLELVTGASAAFWSKLESDYRHEVLRREAESLAATQREWMKQQPVTDLIAANFLPADFRKKSLGDQMALLCRFYNVSSVDAFKGVFTPYKFAARTVNGGESNSHALTAWLQMAVRVAQKESQDITVYRASSFKSALDDIRHKTMCVDNGEMSFKDFLLWTKSELANVGVQVVYLKKIKDVKNLNGVAFWMNEHPVIVLSLHSCAFDRIVFSLYHEASHILDGERELIYVTDKENSDIEIAADERAAEMLIPKSFNEEIRLSNGSILTLKAIAAKTGVSVALTIGRYQKLTNRFFPQRDYTMPMIKWADIGSWVLA